MSYFPGLGLGRNLQGLPRFPDFPDNQHTFGLGYKPTPEDLREKARQARDKAAARKNGQLYDQMMKPHSRSLNGQFVREGENFPFCGFAEFFTDELTGARLPGLEIFFGLELESSEGEAESVEVPEGDYAD